MKNPIDPTLSTTFLPENFHNRRFAHRGGANFGPENTLHAIKNALENGANSIEVDLQLTANNQLILFHDFTVERILDCDYDFEVYELTHKEIASIPLRDTSFGTQYICSLKDLFNYLAEEYSSGRNRNFLIELEIKITDQHSKRAVNELYKMLELYNPKFGTNIYNHFYVGTFFKNVLDDLQDRPKELKLALGLIWRPEYSILLATVAVVLAKIMVKKYRIDIIEPCLKLAKPWYLARWKKRGLLLNVHTANTFKEKKYLKDQNAAYTTDFPMYTHPADIQKEKTINEMMKSHYRIRTEYSNY